MLSVVFFVHNYLVSFFSCRFSAIFMCSVIFFMCRVIFFMCSVIFFMCSVIFFMCSVIFLAFVFSVILWMMTVSLTVDGTDDMRTVFPQSRGQEVTTYWRNTARTMSRLSMDSAGCLLEC